MSLLVVIVSLMMGSFNPATLSAPLAEAAPVQTPVLLPQLVSVCGCESGGSATSTPVQFNPDGSVLHGKKDPSDTGACQINAKTWLGEANALGYDIDTLQGNYAMANYIFQEKGLKPWNTSKACWNK